MTAEPPETDPRAQRRVTGHLEAELNIDENEVVSPWNAALVALAGTGWTAAWIGGAPRVRATARVVVGGALALGATFAIGSLLGTTAVA